MVSPRLSRSFALPGSFRSGARTSVDWPNWEGEVTAEPLK